MRLGVFKGGGGGGGCEEIPSLRRGRLIEDVKVKALRIWGREGDNMRRWLY